MRSKKDFAETRPMESSEITNSPSLWPNWATRLIYCLALAGLVAGQLGRSSWVSLAIGGGLIGWLGPMIFSLIACGLIYRIYLVLRYIGTLRARKPNIFGTLFRGLGVLVMTGGAMGTVAVFFVKPLTLLLLKSPGENGIGYFVVGLYAVAISGVGWIGCVLFEVSRVMGKRSTSNLPGKTNRQRKQDYGVAAVAAVIVIGGPLAFRLGTGEPCYGPNMTRCIASIEGGVSKPAIAPFGSVVSLETNIDEVVFARTSEPRSEVKESPEVSLMKSGHPSLGEIKSAVKVILNATAMPKGVAITLQVFDEQGETAKFVTSIAKDARLEPSKDGKQRVVLSLPTRVQPGMQFPIVDPVTKKTYVLDEIFFQMRQAIASPLEGSELAIKVTREVREISAADIPGVGKIDEARPSASCRDLVKVVHVGENETAIRPSAGSPLNRLIFASAENPESYALSQINDRVGCNADGVWAFNYPAWNGNFEIRRFNKEGKLLNFVSTTLPIDKMHGAWTDMESGKVADGKITFSTLSIPKPGEWKRRVFEVQP